MSPFQELQQLSFRAASKGEMEWMPKKPRFEVVIIAHLAKILPAFIKVTSVSRFLRTSRAEIVYGSGLF